MGLGSGSLRLPRYYRSSLRGSRPIKGLWQIPQRGGMIVVKLPAWMLVTIEACCSPKADIEAPSSSSRYLTITQLQFVIAVQYSAPAELVCGERINLE
jgi:hypothetical protein